MLFFFTCLFYSFSPEGGKEQLFSWRLPPRKQEKPVGGQVKA